MNEKHTGKTVKFRLDPNHPPKLSAETKERLAQMQDQDIDYSDIPPSPIGVEWSKPGALVPSENKQQVTLRLDADVIRFFKCTGKRYQSRINAALREYMNLHRTHI